MQPKFCLYRRSNRANGVYYAENCITGTRESLGTKKRTEALKLLQAKNEPFFQLGVKPKCCGTVFFAWSG